MKYTYRCEHGHIVEYTFPMGENPEWLQCEYSREDAPGITCGASAIRYIGEIPPIRYNGTGFASTEIPRKSGLEGYQS